MLEKEFKFYKNKQKTLVKEYKGKFVVIKGNKLLGDYLTEEQAFTETIKDNKIGTFLIQQCLPGKDNYTQTLK